MKWLEIVELRTASTNTDAVERYLGDWVHKIKIDEKLPQIKIYRRVLVETDISVHLAYESKTMKIDFSSPGTQLASQLKEFGLVNHSVWVEQRHGAC